MVGFWLFLVENSSSETTRIPQKQGLFIVSKTHTNTKMSHQLAT